MRCLPLLLVLMARMAFAEMGEQSLLPTVGLGVGLGPNSATARVEVPFTLFAGVALVPELSRQGEGLRGIGGELIANILFSGSRWVTFEPVLSALVEWASVTVTLGAGPTVKLDQPAIDGAIISASLGSRALFASVRNRSSPRAFASTSSASTCCSGRSLA